MVYKMETGRNELHSALDTIRAHEDHVLSKTAHATLPSASSISVSTQSLLHGLPEQGLGLQNIASHITVDVAPGLNGNSLAATYYGFVTGGITPAARVSEHIASLYDQNVAVHLPQQSIATVVEDRALCMLLDLLRLSTVDWPIRTLTTGATASNIVGLAAARDTLISRRLASDALSSKATIDKLGMVEACRLARIDGWQVLTCLSHSSIAKAANIVGLGSASIVDVGRADNPVTFDLGKLRSKLSIHGQASIVVVSCGEVNSGEFSTHGEQDMRDLRELCDAHGAWLHVDGAFGIFARCLVDSARDFKNVASGALGIELADSITGDGHKMLNVPYDCGFFLSKHQKEHLAVFQNPNASYLAGGGDDIPSPLNIGLENSRRFRGLPLYATLAAYGRQGYVDMIERQVRLSRRIAHWIRGSSAYVLLPQTADPDQTTYMVVLFRARDSALNKELVQRINATRRMYVSGTVWETEPACRIAVSNWQAMDAHYQIVTEVLTLVAESG